jgi:hypothetical protein
MEGSRKLTIVVTILIVIGSLAAPAACIDAHPKPKWEFSLRKFGFRNSLPPEIVVAGETVGVAFAASNPDKLNPANRIGENLFLIHLVTLQLSTGKLVAHKQWVESMPDFTLGSSSTGNFVLLLQQHNDSASATWPATLLFLSHDLQEVKRMELPSANGYDSWQLATSATGRSLLLSHSQGANHSNRHELLDCDTLQSRAVWTDDVIVMGGTIADTFALSWGVTAKPHGAWVVVSPFADHWVALKDFGTLTPALPLGEDRIVGTGETPSTILVTNRAGEKVFARALTASESTPIARVIAASADGTKAAFSVLGKGKHWYYPTRNFVLVYEPPKTDVVFVTTIPGFNPAEAAFSPDATSIVLLAGHSVRAFDLPRNATGEPPQH